MQCPNCHNIVPDVANVCGYCGTRLRQPAPPPAPVQTPPPTRQPIPPPQPVAPPQPVQPVPQPVQPPAPAPLPAQPVAQNSQPSSSAPPRAKMPGWVWGLVGGLVIVVGMAAFFLLNPFRPASPLATEQPPAQVPTAKQPVSAPTSAPTKAPTKRPSSTPAPNNLPDGVSDFLIRAVILESDDFSTHTDLWGNSDSGVKWFSGYAEVTGSNGWQTYLSRGEIFEAGQAALFLFTYDPAMNMTFMLDQGQWQTSNYARYSVNVQEEPISNIWKGTNDLGNARFNGNLALRDGQNYFLLLAIDGEQEFAAVVWDAQNPDENLMFRNGRTPDWPSRGWYLLIQADQGKIKLDEYYLLKFAEFVF